MVADRRPASLSADQAASSPTSGLRRMGVTRHILPNGVTVIATPGHFNTVDAGGRTIRPTRRPVTPAFHNVPDLKS